DDTFNNLGRALEIHTSKMLQELQPVAANITAKESTLIVFRVTKPILAAARRAWMVPTVEHVVGYLRRRKDCRPVAAGALPNLHGAPPIPKERSSARMSACATSEDCCCFALA